MYRTGGRIVLSVGDIDDMHIILHTVFAALGPSPLALVPPFVLLINHEISSSATTLPIESIDYCLVVLCMCNQDLLSSGLKTDLSSRASH